MDVGLFNAARMGLVKGGAHQDRQPLSRLGHFLMTARNAISPRPPEFAPGVHEVGRGLSYTGNEILGNGSFGLVDLVGVGTRLPGRSGIEYGGARVLLAGARKTLCATDERKEARHASIYQRELDALRASAAEPHPHLQRLLALDDDRYIVTRLAVTNLKHYLATAPMPLPEAVRLARECCEGVRHLHALGYLHLDLKLSNILIDAAGHAIVSDIGGNPIDRVPRYAGQQPLPDNEPRSVKSDVFGLARLAFEMISGRSLLQPKRRGKSAFCFELCPRSLTRYLEGHLLRHPKCGMEVTDGRARRITCRDETSSFAQTLVSALGKSPEARPCMAVMLEAFDRFESFLEW